MDGIRTDPPSNNTSNASSEAAGPCMTDLSSTLNTSKDRCAQYNWHKALDNLIENLEQWDVEISPAEFLEQMRTGKEQGLLTEETLEKLTKDCFKKGSRPKPDVANYALLDVLLEHFDPKVPELNFEEAGVTTSLPQWFDTPGTTEFMLPSAWIQRAAQDGSVKMLDFIEKKYKENGIDFECGYEQAPKYFHDPDYQLRRPIQQANLYFQYKTTGKWFEDRGFNDHYDDPETKMDHQYAILLSAMKRDREATKQKILAAQECNMDLSQLFDSYHMSEWYVEGRHVMIGDAQYFEDREITPLVRQLRANNSDSALSKAFNMVFQDTRDHIKLLLQVYNLNRDVKRSIAGRLMADELDQPGVAVYDGIFKNTSWLPSSLCDFLLEVMEEMGLDQDLEKLKALKNIERSAAVLGSTKLLGHLNPDFTTPFSYYDGDPVDQWKPLAYIVKRSSWLRDPEQGYTGEGEENLILTKRQEEVLGWIEEEENQKATAADAATKIQKVARGRQGRKKAEQRKCKRIYGRPRSRRNTVVMTEDFINTTVQPTKKQQEPDDNCACSLCSVM